MIPGRPQGLLSIDNRPAPQHSPACRPPNLACCPGIWGVAQSRGGDGGIAWPTRHLRQADAGDTSANGMYAVSTATGQLNTPDGFDLLLPDDSTPTHPATGAPRHCPQPRQHQGRAKT